MQTRKVSRSTSLSREQIQKAQAYIRHSPRWYFQRILGASAWDGQVKVAESVRDNDHTCVPSCHAAGKDWIAARIVLWFLHAYGPNCIVITTAPGERQVKNILWREIRDAMNNAKTVMPGYPPMKMGINIAEKWYAIGFAAPDYDATKMQGWHANNMLIVFDEAIGISKDIREASEGNLSAGVITRLLEIGNPTDPGSEFRKMCESETTNTIRFSAFDTPNFKAFGIVPDDFRSDDWEKKMEGKELPAPYLINPRWVAKHISRYGWDDPFTVSRIMGQFPAAGPDTLINHSWIESARTADKPEQDPVILTCDVARFGDDYTVIGIRRGAKYRRLFRQRGVDTRETSDRLMWLWRKEKADSIRVDADGVGGGVVDNLMTDGAPVVAMHAAAEPSTAEDKTRYYNARAQWHWNLRDAFRLHEVDIDPEDELLIDQLKQLKIGGFPKGRILIEDKDDFKARVGYSPDDSDAMMFAFADVPEKVLQVF